MALPVQTHLWETLGLAHPDAKFTGPAIMLRAPQVPDAVFEADFRKCSQTIPRLQVLNVSSIGQAQNAIVHVVRSAGGRQSVVIIEGHGSSDYHEESHKRTGHRSKKPTFVDLGKEHLSTDHIRDALVFQRSDCQLKGLLKLYANICFGYNWTKDIQSIDKNKDTSEMSVELYCTTSPSWIEEETRQWGVKSWFTTMGSKNVQKDCWFACVGPAAVNEE